ncbi:MAG: molybdopterin-containing oxidoreductase family protein [Vicinamibacterales bacterium]
MDRRSFIKLTAVSGTTAALASCGNPDHQLVRFVPDEDIVPGQAVWKPGVCPLCPSGCGLTVRVMDADAEVVRDGKSGVVQILAAKKLEGNPSHPINRGGLCARGQAAIQVTYHPDRITQPLKRTGNRGAGTYEAVTWDAAIAEVVGSLNTLAGGGNVRSLAFLGRPGNGHRQALIAEFLARFGAPAPVTYELFADDVLRRANGISFGSAQLPTFDLANTRYLLSFGADFLGTWNAPVSHARGYGDMRQGQPGVRGHFVQIESRVSQTGASADEWVAIRPGSEGTLALGLAHVIMRDKLQAAAAAASIPGWAEGLPDYTPEQVEKVTGVAAAKVERLAREFAGRSPAAAAVGGAALAHTNALFTAVAVNALNALAGTVGKPGGLLFTPQMDVAAAAKIGRGPSAAVPLQQWSAGLLGGGEPAAQALLIDGVNPVFTAPRAWKVRDAIAKIPFIVSFGGFLDETSVLADLILPDHSFLESWTESVPESGSSVAVVSAAPPVMKALHQTRATPDVLLEVGRQLEKPLELPWQTFDEMLAMTLTPLPAMTEGVDAWTDAQEKGGWWGELPQEVRLKADTTTTIRLKPDSTGVESGFSRIQTGVESGFSRIQPEFDGDPAQYPFHFLPYPSNQFLDGSLAHLPWLQEMPDPLTSAMWSSWIEINPQTAARLGIVQGDLVEVTSQHGTLRSAAYLSPGTAPDVIAMPAGQGHANYTRYASGRGENPVDVLAPTTEETTGAVAWAATRVKIARLGEADGRLILFAGGMREHVEHGR